MKWPWPQSVVPYVPVCLARGRVGNLGYPAPIANLRARTPLSNVRIFDFFGEQQA